MERGEEGEEEEETMRGKWRNERGKKDHNNEKKNIFIIFYKNR